MLSANKTQSTQNQQKCLDTPSRGVKLWFYLPYLVSLQSMVLAVKGCGSCHCSVLSFGDIAFDFG